jgi:histidinol dehydrogenase
VNLRRLTAAEWRAEARRRRLGDEEQAAAVREICRRVEVEGDVALFELSRRFDGWAPGPGEPLAVGRPAMEAALAALPARQRAALVLAAERIRAFSGAERHVDVEGPEGLRLQVRPVRRAGLYVPGGRVPYPSTVLMTAIPARVAGVQEVWLATPPAADGSIAPAVLSAAALAGVDLVFRMGGAQAIAAFAYGTSSVPRVDVVAGPGNVYVTLAKKEVFGAVGVDALAGPTEVAIVADRTAAADLVAADLASQMEHDPMVWALLLTDSDALIDAVEEAMADLVPGLERREVVERATCRLVLTPSLEEAVALADDFAPEHLQLVGEQAERLVDRVENAGAIFLGPHTPVSLGDYVIGPNHTLPTQGSARFGSPLGVHTFLKRRSLARVDRTTLEGLIPAAATLARMEGLTAHARAIELRAP